VTSKKLEKGPQFNSAPIMVLAAVEKFLSKKAVNAPLLSYESQREEILKKCLATRTTGR